MNRIEFFFFERIFVRKGSDQFYLHCALCIYDFILLPFARNSRAALLMYVYVIRELAKTYSIHLVYQSECIACVFFLFSKLKCACIQLFVFSQSNQEFLWPSNVFNLCQIVKETDRDNENNKWNIHIYIYIQKITPWSIPYGIVWA